MMTAVGNPAANIHDLVDRLKREHRPGYLYRGQNVDYPVMVPSMCRPLVVDLADPSPIARVDPRRFEEASRQTPRSRTRSEAFLALIQNAGLALGNIIAQQYGLTSEAVDVTENIDVAAFFATRRYPGYYHIESGGLGVIYRFDARDHLNVHAPYELSQLAAYFEYGKSDDGYFEFFVDSDKTDTVFEQDKWFGHQPDKRSTVRTLSFSTSWTDLYQAIVAHGKGFGAGSWGSWVFLAESLNDMDWRRTRFAGQHGGFVRPSFFWDCRVPSQFRLAHNWRELTSLRGGAPHGLEAVPGLIEAWPLVVPSAAIKDTLRGIENLRARDDCETFLFAHSEKRIGGLYRRFLWPEPVEDRLYGALWNHGIALQMPHYPNDAPPIDDPKEGVFDRGYQLANERHTRDGRDDGDLMRGQLEDALDGINWGADKIFHQSRHAFALQALGRHLEALRSLLAALRAAPDNFELLLGLSEFFRHRRKLRWRARAIEKAHEVAPDDPATLQAMAYLRMDEGKLDVAARYLDEALARLDEAVHRRLRDDFLRDRAILAGALGDERRFRALSRYLQGRFFDIAEIERSAAQLRTWAQAIAGGKNVPGGARSDGPSRGR